MSAMRRLLLVAAVAATLLALTDAKSAKKPASAYFNLCKRHDAGLNKCVMDNIISHRDQFVAGIPELRLIPLDPMNIPRMELTEGQGNFRFKQTLNNLTIYGLKDFVLKQVDVKWGPANLTIKMEMFTPSMKMTADYVMDGQILVLPIKGDGDCVFDFSDVTTVSTMRGRIVQRDGAEHIAVDSVTWDIRVGGAKSQFNNLFNGDKMLGEATNTFLNRNWALAFETYKHLPEEAFGLVFQDLTEQVFRRYSLKELFLD